LQNHIPLSQPESNGLSPRWQ